MIVIKVIICIAEYFRTERNRHGKRFDFAQREEHVLKIKQPPRIHGVAVLFFDSKIFLWGNPFVDVAQNAGNERVATDGHTGDGRQGLS